ncbi:hypothetical protein V1512DRAFT_261806 [Lipomyces arxii]|uniref:uncharacterized protein n=1 Tax=Lipomyces arxii TaxID=56418 RepID=UPI0034CD9DDC
MFTTNPIGRRRIGTRTSSHLPPNVPSAPLIAHNSMPQRRPPPQRQQRHLSPAASEASEISVQSRYSTRSTGKVVNVLEDNENVINMRKSRKSTPSVDGSEKSTPRRSQRLVSSGGSTPNAIYAELAADAERMTETVEQSYGFEEEDEMYRQLAENSNLMLDLDPASSLDSLNGGDMYRSSRVELVSRYIWSVVKSAIFKLVLFCRSQVFVKRVVLPAAVLLLSLWYAPILYKLFSSGTIRFPSIGVPQGVPQTNEEVVIRLLNLETKLAKLSHASINFQSEYLHTVKQSESKLDEFTTFVNQQLDKITAESGSTNGDVKKTYSSLSSAFRDFQVKSDKMDERLDKLDEKILAETKAESIHFDELDREVMKMLAHLAQTNTEMELLKEQLESLDEKSKGHDARLEVVGTTLTGLEAKVNDVVSHVAQVAQESALSAIDKILPDRLPVRFDESGSISITPEFYAYLKSAFPSDSKNSENVVSWEEFLIKNEETLNRFVDAHVKGYVDRLDERESFVSRGYFVDLLRHEMASVKDEFVHKLRQSELDIERLVNDKVAKSRVTSVGQGGNLTQSAIDILIDEALMRFQDGMMRKKDYADIRYGARSDPHVSSLSFDPYKTGNRNIFAKLFGLKPPSNQQGEALSSDIVLGNCWAFQGQEGRLGIRLSELIYIEEVAINHLPKTLTKDWKLAPKEFEVWIDVPSDRKRRELQDALQGAFTAKRLVEVQDGSEKVLVKNSGESAGGMLHPLLTKYVKIGQFTYDINGPFHQQAFRFPRQANEILRTTPVGSVLFRFTQNWGAEVSCIYKVLVHGEPVVSGSSGDSDTLGAARREDDWGLGDDIPF